MRAGGMVHGGFVLDRRFLRKKGVSAGYGRMSLSNTKRRMKDELME